MKIRWSATLHRADLPDDPSLASKPFMAVAPPGAVTVNRRAWPGSNGLDGVVTHCCVRAAGLPSVRPIQFQVPLGSSNSDGPLKCTPRRVLMPFLRWSCSVKNTRSWLVRRASASAAYIDPTPSENEECTCIASR